MDLAALRAPLDLLRDPTLVSTEHGKILLANRAAGRCLARSCRELEGSDLVGLGCDGSEVEKLTRRWGRTKDLSPGVLQFQVGERLQKLRCDGALLEVRAEGRPALLLLQLRDQNVAVSPFAALNERVDALTREISRRMAVERELAEQREWFRVTLSSIGDGVIATDQLGIIAFMNAAAERFTGWTSKEALGRALEDVFVITNEDTGEVVEAPIQRVLQSGVVVGLANHTMLTRKDGSKLAIADSAAPIIGDRGEVRGVVLVFQDETTRRSNDAARAELLRREREARERAEAVSRLKDEFLATLSHELRTPLTAIIGWAEFLQKPDCEPEKLRHALEVIHRNARDQARLVEELLDVARVTAGRLELTVEDVDLCAVARHAVEAVSHAARAKGVELELSAPEDSLALTGDRVRLQQAVWNLISNAVKFTPRGGHVVVTVCRNGSAAEVRVSDDGIGIDAAELPRLFEPFWQSDARRIGRERGLGLGLSIVSRIAEAHGGKVQVESRGPGRGSQFCIRLPTSAVTCAQAARDERPSRPFAGNADLSGVKLLLVEDEEDSREMLEELMRLHGAEVRAAANAGEALSILESWIPSVIMSDISMPGMDGYEFVRALRARRQSQAASVPAIALTAFATAEHREKCLRAGFQHHVAKPVDPGELANVIRSIVKSSN